MEGAQSSASSARIRCSACFKQFSSRQHLLQHLEKAGHSEHEPQCGVCHKHCPCYESLREHLLGRLAKKDCANEFAKRGCIYCLEFMKSEDSLTDHCIQCQYVDASPIGQVSNCHFFPCIFVQLLSLGMEVFQNVLTSPSLTCVWSFPYV
jgi:hypothetical protein